MLTSSSSSAELRFNRVSKSASECSNVVECRDDIDVSVSGNKLISN